MEDGIEAGRAAVPVLILAGGRGARLSGVSDLPKPLLEVSARPFITFLLEALWRQGFRRIVLLTGHGAEHFPRRLGGAAASGALSFLRELDLDFLPEDRPLGTAGALRRAVSLVAHTALILNGDSYCGADYGDFLGFHRGRGAAVSLAAVRVEDARDYGRLDLDAAGRVISFREKGPAGPGWINAGVYAMDRRFLDHALPEGVVSLEREVLPDWCARASLWAYRAEVFFHDIGTPERLAAAEREFPPPDLRGLE